jgi:serine/threonine protein kinase
MTSFISNTNFNEIAFVAPELKQVLETQSQAKNQGINFKYSESGDVYSFGVLLFMMVTLTCDPFTLSNSLTAPDKCTFEEHLKKQILLLPVKEKYSSKMINLIVKSLNAKPAKRASVKQLMSLLQ